MTFDPWTCVVRIICHVVLIVPVALACLFDGHRKPGVAFSRVMHDGDEKIKLVSPCCSEDESESVNTAIFRRRRTTGNPEENTLHNVTSIVPDNEISIIDTTTDDLLSTAISTEDVLTAYASSIVASSTQESSDEVA